jgi:hypothetical protein
MAADLSFPFHNLRKVILIGYILLPGLIGLLFITFPYGGQM